MIAPSDSTMQTNPEVSLSVVIPVYNGEGVLRQCLAAIRDSQHQPLEIIVVNDGSIDSSVTIAMDLGATVLDMPAGPAGPAAARLLGVQTAKGSVIVFVDADVWLHRDALGRFAQHFKDSSLAAVFGSYDDSPPATNFVSQWKNLSHHFFHQVAHRNAQTFWSGCGAVRQDVFLSLGGFDLRYRGATIEDIEFGYRLRAAGHRILLDRDIQASHAKRWTAWSAWKTDLLYRGIPWMRLILRSGKLPNDLNTSLSQRFSVLAGASAPMLLLASLVALPFDSALVLLLFLLLLLSRYWLDPFSTPSRSRGWLRALAVGGSAVVLAPVVDAPLLSIPFLLLPVHTLVFHGRPGKHPAHAADLSFGFLLLVAAMITIGALPTHAFLFLLLAAAIALLALNSQYFEFLSSKRGLDFAATALPLQSLHFLAGALSAGIAIVLHAVDKSRGE